MSAKEGTGIPELLEAIVARVPPPRGNADAPLRALIFDSYYDRYRGAMPSIRVVDGDGPAGHEDRLRLPPRRRVPRGRGRLPPAGPAPTPTLEAGEVGYVVASLRDVRDARVGDTILDARRPRGGAAARLPRREVDGVRRALPDRLGPVRERCATRSRSSSSTTRRSTTSRRSSTALGFGFRCGFLGLLHMEIVQERLEREFNLDLITTVPTVEYHVLPHRRRHDAPGEPDATCPTRPTIARIEEPYVKARIMAPAEYIGGIMKLGQDRRGVYNGMHYLDTAARRVRLRVPARRDRPRLLRQAEVDQPRLRLARLRDGRTTASRTS